MSRRVWLLGGLLIFGLPLAARLSRRGEQGRCALDGAAIEPRFRVRLVNARGVNRTFCSLTCLANWLSHETDIVDLYLTDEQSGREIDAESAWLVRSSVITHPASGNKIHCFARREDALRHAGIARGQLLTEIEKPWRVAGQHFKKQPSGEE